ncbi:MAG: hypothetical protein COB20_06770 [SAR86 cluster bacterium]|uniref:Uncharacterized protein n=1 Tax=SAR86 cluster bacterium TaxID=2030880 RepID=A0A2A4X750_9GAMM|nr:MAG: hypothetical protein COB20_06770 [SAR86 cluster bacterium]
MNIFSAAALLGMLYLNLSTQVLFAAELSVGDAEVKSLVGDWEGTIRFESRDLRVLWRFEETEDGSVIGFMDQYSRAIATTPMQELILTGSKLQFLIDGGYRFSGQVIRDAATGSWLDDGELVSISMERKKLKPLTEKSKRVLVGAWTGKARGYNLTFHFDEDESGFNATVDAKRFVVLGSEGLAIIDLELDNGHIRMKVPRIEAEFEGELAGDEFRGQLTFKGKSSPLTINRLDN